MLDEYRPTKLARDRSYLRQMDEDTLEVKLAHMEDENVDVLVEFSRREATVSWSLSHEHAYPEDAGEHQRPWTGLVVDLVASVLRGDAILETVHRGDTWVKTRNLLINDDGNEEVYSVSGSILGWLLRWKPERTTRYRPDYGVDREPPTGK